MGLCIDHELPECKLGAFLPIERTTMHRLAKLSRIGLAMAFAAILGTGCSRKPSLIYPAPGSTIPGTWIIGADKEGVDVSKWIAAFSHRDPSGAWIPDTTMSMASEPVIVFFSSQTSRFFPKGGKDAKRFRVQVLSGNEVLDELELERE